MTVTEPPHTGAGEREVLLAFLQRQRDLVAWKLAGLSDDDARSVATPSGLTVHVLVRHLRGVERGWLREIFAGEPQERVRDAEFTAPAVEPLADLLAAYAAESARCDAVVRAADLDDTAVREGFSLRWIVHHLVEETARHLGHLDLLCELADGRTGEEPERP